MRASAPVSVLLCTALVACGDDPATSASASGTATSITTASPTTDPGTGTGQPTTGEGTGGSNSESLSDSNSDPGTDTSAAPTTGDSGPGSLRQAMLDADQVVAGSPHRIRFQIPGSGPHVIAPQSPLPTLANESIRLDGFTQPGSRPNALSGADDAQLAIVLDGTDRQLEFGLRFATPGNEVIGLSIVRFLRWR